MVVRIHLDFAPVLSYPGFEYCLHICLADNTGPVVLTLWERTVNNLRGPSSVPTTHWQVGYSIVGIDIAQSSAKNYCQRMKSNRNWEKSKTRNLIILDNAGCRNSSGLRDMLPILLEPRFLCRVYRRGRGRSYSTLLKSLQALGLSTNADAVRRVPSMTGNGE